MRDLARTPPAVRADDPECHPEEIRTKGTGEVELRPVSVQHDEDLLREILDFARAGAESLQRLEYVVQLPVERLEAGGLGRRHGRRRMDEAKIPHGHGVIGASPLLLFIEIAGQDRGRERSPRGA